MCYPTLKCCALKQKNQQMPFSKSLVWPNWVSNPDYHASQANALTTRPRGWQRCQDKIRWRNQTFQHSTITSNRVTSLYRDQYLWLIPPSQHSFVFIWNQTKTMYKILLTVSFSQWICWSISLGANRMQSMAFRTYPTSNWVVTPRFVSFGFVQSICTKISLLIIASKLMGAKGAVILMQ